MDTSAILGFKQPDATQQLSGLLNVAKSAQELQNTGIGLGERQAMQQVLKDPSNYTDETGAFDLNRAQSSIMKAAPTTGAKYIQELATAHKLSTDASSALNSLTTENRSQIGRTLAAIPPGTPADVVHQTVEALGKQYKGSDPLISLFKRGYEQASKTGGQKAADDFVLQSARGVLPQDTQQGMSTPAGVNVSDGQTSRIVNIKPGVQGMPQGATLPGTEAQMKVGPGSLEAVDTDAAGNKHIVSRTPTGAIVGTRPLGSSAPSSPGMFTLPPGETQDTYKDMQGQRSAAQAAANGAPVLHDINQTIVREASKGLNTGALGQLTQKLASATGYNIGDEKATDYNLLGKMLERSALVAAQSMGPHTNAGLEAAIKANGSLEYTPQAIKKIAYLNDALVHGTELYRQALEKAIQGDPTQGVFAKRQFDQQWSKVASPQALRLKNAVDAGNKEEIDAITKEVGGKGTAGAKRLHEQLSELLRMAGQ